MNRWCWPLMIFVGCFGLITASLPASAGHLVLSVNDGKYPMIDGVYKVADPASPDTLTILDVASFPPRVKGETEVHHSVIGPPVGVALTPDEKLALVSIPNRVDQNDKTKVVLEVFLQVLTWRHPLPPSSRGSSWVDTRGGFRSAGPGIWRSWPSRPRE